MTDIQEGAEAPADDLRATLESAFDSPPADPAPADDPARDEQGRFAKSDDSSKDAADATEQPEPDDQAEAKADTQAAVQMPPSWKGNEALWKQLTPEHQQILLKRESDYAKGIEEKALKLKPWEKVENLLQPHLTKYQMQGVTGDQLVERLISAHNLLENPQTREQAWQYLFQTYGAPQFLAQQPAAYNQQQQFQQPDPYLTGIAQEVNALKQHYLAQQEATITQQVQEYAKTKPFFDAAEATIERLLRENKADSLDEAYEMAIWTDPEVRKQVLAAEAKSQSAKSGDATAKAKKAASSVTGAPTGGVQTGPAESLRAELEAAFERF